MTFLYKILKGIGNTLAFFLWRNIEKTLMLLAIPGGLLSFAIWVNPMVERYVTDRFQIKAWYLAVDFRLCAYPSTDREKHGFIIPGVSAPKLRNNNKCIDDIEVLPRIFIGPPHSRPKYSFYIRPSSSRFYHNLWGGSDRKIDVCPSSKSPCTYEEAINTLTTLLRGKDGNGGIVGQIVYAGESNTLNPVPGREEPQIKLQQPDVQVTLAQAFTCYKVLDATHWSSREQHEALQKGLITPLHHNINLRLSKTPCL